MALTSSRAVFASAMSALFLAACGPGGTVGAAADAESETQAPAETADLTRALPSKWKACSNAPDASATLNTAAAAILEPHTGGEAPAGCLTPLHVTAQDDMAYLLTMEGLPGDDCHGCAADMSVHVLQMRGDEYGYVTTFRNAVATGTWGDPGLFTDVSIDGAPGVAIEHGGTFQGYGYGVVTFVRMTPAGPQEIGQSPVLCTASSNGGALEEDSPDYFAIDATWHLAEDGRKLKAEVTVFDDNEESKVALEWTLQGADYVLTSGDYPEPLGGETCV